MSLLTQAYLLENFGPRLTIDQIAQVLGLKPGTVYNQVSAQTFPVKTYTEGGKRFADFRDLAEYLDECRHRAA